MSWRKIDRRRPRPETATNICSWPNAKGRRTSAEQVAERKPSVANSYHCRSLADESSIGGERSSVAAQNKIGLCPTVRNFSFWELSGRESARTDCAIGFFIDFRKLGIAEKNARRDLRETERTEALPTWRNTGPNGNSTARQLTSLELRRVCHLIYSVAVMPIFPDHF